MQCAVELLFTTKLLAGEGPLHTKGLKRRGSYRVLMLLKKREESVSNALMMSTVKLLGETTGSSTSDVNSCRAFFVSFSLITLINNSFSQT